MTEMPYRIFALSKHLIDEEQIEEMYRLIDLFNESKSSWLDEDGYYFIGAIEESEEEEFINYLVMVGIDASIIALR